jgi:hypothetical protein
MKGKCDTIIKMLISSGVAITLAKPPSHPKLPEAFPLVNHGRLRPKCPLPPLAHPTRPTRRLPPPPPLVLPWPPPCSHRPLPLAVSVVGPPARHLLRLLRFRVKRSSAPYHRPKCRVSQCRGSSTSRPTPVRGEGPAACPALPLYRQPRCFTPSCSSPSSACQREPVFEPWRPPSSVLRLSCPSAVRFLSLPGPARRLPIADSPSCRPPSTPPAATPPSTTSPTTT